MKLPTLPNGTEIEVNNRVLVMVGIAALLICVFVLLDDVARSKRQPSMVAIVGQKPCRCQEKVDLPQEENS